MITASKFYQGQKTLTLSGPLQSWLIHMGWYSDGSSIVFVHGLNGHRKASWTSGKITEPASVFWPEKLLAEDCPTARILMYGYDATLSLFMAGPGHPIDIFRAGQDLVNYLVTKRRAENGRDCVRRHVCRDICQILQATDL